MCCNVLLGAFFRHILPAEFSFAQITMEGDEFFEGFHFNVVSRWEGINRKLLFDNIIEMPGIKAIKRCCLLKNERGSIMIN